MKKIGIQNEVVHTVSISSFFIIMLMVILAIYSTHILFFILFGMLPGFIAGVVDRYINRYLTKIVVLFNFAGIAPYLIQFIVNYNRAHDIAIKFILEPKTWLYIYTYCAIGWIVYWSFPNLNLLIKNISIQFKVNDLNNELDKLTKEWGNEIKNKNRE